jgi:hypothetical protein
LGWRYVAAVAEPAGPGMPVKTIIDSKKAGARPAFS